jgi:uroporphyrinogen decarboxylase
VLFRSGLIGEVKAPIVVPGDDDWISSSGVHFPEELLTLDKKKVNEYCAATDRFVLAGELARPFERMQFIRGTEELYVDLALGNQSMLAFMDRVHDFFRRLLTVWAETDVDGLFFMDDWGSQRGLLINPELWVRLIKPMYRDYVDIAHSHGKKIFFHSDGYTLDIIPHLIDIGVDAANLQIFCIGPEKVEQFRGKITFWGEIDRQDILPFGTPDDVRAAVERVRPLLWKSGGAIAQCEFGAGAKPENVREVFAAWDRG